MDPHQNLQDVFLFIILPIAGICACVATFGGKLKTAGMICAGLIIGAVFMYMPGSTLATIGKNVATGVAKFLHIA